LTNGLTAKTPVKKTLLSESDSLKAAADALAWN